MLHHSSDAVAAAVFASHRYDNAASLSARRVPAPAAVGSEPTPHLSVQSLPTYMENTVPSTQAQACHILHLP